MNKKTKIRAVAGAAALITGVMLIGTSGLTFVVGWALWATGLGAVLAAAPTADAVPQERAPARFSVVR